jgi:hypothetical protein
MIRQQVIPYRKTYDLRSQIEDYSISDLYIQIRDLQSINLRSEIDYFKGDKISSLLEGSTALAGRGVPGSN